MPQDHRNRYDPNRFFSPGEEYTDVLINKSQAIALIKSSFDYLAENGRITARSKENKKLETVMDASNVLEDIGFSSVGGMQEIQKKLLDKVAHGLTPQALYDVVYECEGGFYVAASTHAKLPQPSLPSV